MDRQRKHHLIGMKCVKSILKTRFALSTNASILQNHCWMIIAKHFVILILILLLALLMNVG